MGRRKKQPEVNLSALEHIPAVKAALLAIGLEMVIRPPATYGPIKHVYLPATIGPETMAASAANPGDIILNTPGRLEWEQQNAEVAAALQAERALSAPKPPEKPKSIPAAQRKAIENGMIAEMQSERKAKMAQFKHDDLTPELNGVTASMNEEINTLSEAT